MSGLWKEIIRLKFKGKRFEGHALDSEALGEVCQFFKIVTETAKEIWHSENPERPRLPKNFEDNTRLYLSAIGSGSTEAVVGTCIEPRDTKMVPDLFEKELEPLKKAVETAQEIFKSQEGDNPIPTTLSQDLIKEYGKFGQGLLDDETIELTPVWISQKPARVTRQTSIRLARYKEEKYEDFVDISGEVTAASVRQNRFELLLDDESHVDVIFTPEQEEQVTEALHMHRTIRVQVKGKGKRSPQGKLEGVDEINEGSCTL